MARRYTRAVVANDRYRVNGHVCEGLEVTILGRCTAGGMQKDGRGKPLPKKQLTHNLARWSEKRTYRQLGLPVENFVISDWSMEKFFELVTD